MSEELKPCPFCGGEARLLLNAKRKIYGKDEYRTGVVACCNVCEARMFYGSEKLAIEAWNRRKSDGSKGESIRKEDAIDALKQQAKTMSEWSNRYAEQRKGVLSAVNIIEDLPSAEPERKTGKWINCKYPLGECSECHAVVDIQNNEANYCPVCGSRNRGEKDE